MKPRGLHACLLHSGVWTVALWVALPAGAAAAPVRESSYVQWLPAVSAESQAAQGSGPTPATSAAYVRLRRVSLDSEVTTLFCSVLDQRGEPVFGIQPHHLTLTLDGRPAPVVDVRPLVRRADLHLVIVLALGFTDTQTRAPRALSALSSAFLPELEEGKSDLCALLTFDEEVSVPRLFSSDPLLLKQSLSSIHFSGEGLAVNAAVDAARTLIYQHDTSGFGAVVLLCDLEGARVSPRGWRGLSDPRPGPPLFALGIQGNPPAPVDSLAALCQATRGELFVASGDSLALRTAVGRIMRQLQEQYVITVAGRAAGRLTLRCGEATDSVVLAGFGQTPPVSGGPESSRSRLVVVSLLVGFFLLLAILVMHSRNRAR